MRGRSPSSAANLIERIEGRRLQRELDLNRFIESRRPGIRPTKAYALGALPPSDVRFYSPSQYTTYRIRREMGKYDPNIRYPTPRDKR